MAATASISIGHAWSSVANAQTVCEIVLGVSCGTDGAMRSANPPSKGPGWKPSRAKAHAMAASTPHTH